VGGSSRRRTGAFSQGSASGRGTPVNPSQVPGAASVPLITPHFEEAHAQVNTESVNESGIPQSTTEGNATSAAPATPIRDPKHGFYKENGEFETDPAKIASAFVMRPATTRSTGQPFGARHPEYIHPESGVSTQNISTLNENLATPKLNPGIRIKFDGPNAHRFKLTDFVPGQYVKKQGEIIPSGMGWDGSEKGRAKHEGQFLDRLVMPAALKIAAIHLKLNDEKRGGPSGVVAVADKNDTATPQCSFCGTVGEPKDTSSFISEHAITKNGWCKAAVMSHNAMHPIKGDIEEL
jgi:hypothetical protein